MGLLEDHGESWEELELETVKEIELAYRTGRLTKQYVTPKRLRQEASCVNSLATRLQG